MIQTLNRNLRKLPTWAVYLAGLLPLAWLIWRLFSGQLGPDPVRPLENQLGLTALKLIVAGLMISPLRRYLNLNLMKFRRALGLLAFFYVALHLSAWLLLDMQLIWGQIWADIVKRPYITVGMAGFAILIVLAATSNNTAIRRLGAARWRRLHRLTYLAALLGALHYVMLVKGWQMQPLVFAAVILGLLVLRLPRKRHRLAV